MHVFFFSCTLRLIISKARPAAKNIILFFERKPVIIVNMPANDKTGARTTKLKSIGVRIPIIFFSGIVKDKSIHEILKPFPKSCFLSKPLDKDELLKKIEEFLGKKNEEK